MKSKRTEEVAKFVASEYMRSKDILKLIRDVSEYSVWFGRYGRQNRILFLETLKKELDLRI